jgi:hypothetical protein
MSYLTDGTTVVSLDLGLGTTMPNKLLDDSVRTVGGKLSYTLWSEINIFQLETRWVPSSDARLINEWWTDSNSLSLHFGPFDTDYSVKIVMTEQPYQQLEKAYNDLFVGTILLEGI